MINLIRKALTFRGSETVSLNTEDMELVSREEFPTEFGTGIREVYKKGKRTLEVTCTPTEESLIRAALDAAGYKHEEATEENLRECFTDYVDAGVWHDVDREDIEELTVIEMAKGLISYGRKFYERRN